MKLLINLLLNMRKVIHIVILCCIWCCGQNTVTQSSVEECRNLRFERNRLIVTATLQDSTDVEMIFDSGCINGFANIDSAMVVKLHGKQDESDNKTKSMLLQIGGYPLKYQCFVNSYTKPLIGLNCKDSLLRWNIDIARGNISPIPNDSLLNVNGYYRTPLRIVYGVLPIAEIPVTIYKDGKKYCFKRSFLVDTGLPTAFCITDPDIELLNFVNEIPHCQYEDSLTDEFKKRGRKRIFSRFMLDSISVFNSVVGKSCCCIDVGVRSARSEFGGDVVGMIGMGVLKDFNFIFDYKDSQLLSVPHEKDMPFYEQAESGLGFTYSKRLRVSFVEIGHNAQKAGLQSGDEIVSINNIPLAELLNTGAMDSIRELPNGTPIHLQIKRNGKVLGFEYLSHKSLN